MGETRMIEVFKINKEVLSDYWPYMRPFLQSALEKFDMDKRFPIDYVLLDLTAGRSQGWVIVESGTVVSAIVTEQIQYPLGKALNIFLVGGENMAEWGDILHESMVKYARENGISWIDTGSRRGIGKKFYDRLGYRRKYENYTFEVLADE